MSECESTPESDLKSALSILDYGCDEGSWGKEAAAVRALIAENERLAAGALYEALREIADYLRGPHRKAGAACGVDACVLCLAEATALAAMESPG